jgi:hypothetical protein
VGVYQKRTSIDASFVGVYQKHTSLDVSFVDVKDSFAEVDTSFVGVYQKHTSLDVSFVDVKDSFAEVDASFVGVYQKHTSIDASFGLLTQQIGSGDGFPIIDASFVGVYQKHTSIDASFVLLTQQIGSSDSFSIIDASFVDIRDNLILVDASLSLLANQQGIFTSDDSENYFTDKNVNIVNTLEGYKFTVNGGVRIYDTNLPPQTIGIQNDWVKDSGDNIYFEGGKVGVGVYNTSDYILDVRGGVRISDSVNERLNILDLEGGWLNGGGFIYYANRVRIGVVVTTDTTSMLIVKGKITADVVELSSDKRLKTNIKDISGIDILRQLQPKQYIKENKKEIGFIANDILDIDDISFVVSKSGEYYTLNYNSIFTIAVQGIKELDEKNQSLEKRIERLEALLLDK